MHHPHPLIRLAGLMDRELIEHHFSGHFKSGRGMHEHLVHRVCGNFARPTAELSAIRFPCGSVQHGAVHDSEAIC